MSDLCPGAGLGGARRGRSDRQEMVKVSPLSRKQDLSLHVPFSDVSEAYYPFARSIIPAPCTCLCTPPWFEVKPS